MKIITVMRYEPTNHGSAARMATASRMRSFTPGSARGLAEEAGRAEEQDGDEETEAHQLLHGRREEDGAHRLGERDENAAHEGSGQASHAPDDDDVERGDGQPEPARGLYRQDGRDERAPGAHAGRSHPECGTVHLAHVRPVPPRSVRHVGGRATHSAEFTVTS